MAKTKVPDLAVAVVYEDKVVFLKGYGVRKIGKNSGVFTRSEIVPALAVFWLLLA